MDRPLYSLHLFAGAGGGILADILTGVQPVCAVEIEPYPQRVLAKRFPGLPVWDDVCTFRADNPDCADAFAWMREHRDALVVAGGFPCQDISCAGKGGGVEGGERSGLWREFARILGEIRPRFAFVENSPFLVGRGLGIVLGDMAALGYDARWQVLAAGDVGARHLRERIWIAAARDNRDEQLLCKVAGVEGGGANSRPRSNSSIPDSASPRCRRWNKPTPRMGGGAQRNLTDLAAGMQYPTPRAHDRLPGGGNSEMNRHTPGLNAIAARYPTPASSEDHARTKGDTQASRCLGALAKVAKFPTCGCRNMGGASGSFHKLRALADAGQITEDERRNMASGAQLNPDWVEWLMGWPVGWTDIGRDECDWRDLSNEPEDIHIATTRRDNRPARIKAIGNGQVPLCAAVAAESGFAFLEAVHELQAASAATARGGLPATPGAGLSDLADGFDRAGGHFHSRTVTV